ncbi:MAG: alpha-mannosidase [Fervidobacterium sp.]|uniref:alpha-mannosidase n=1 Tax=Fervidobacterium sp. TaxID=1871331 RepID=UPI00404A271B
MRKKDFEIGHLYRLLGELAPYAVVSKRKYEHWKHDENEISLPYKWDERTPPAVFVNSFKFTPLEEGYSCYLRAWFGGESLVLVDSQPYGEVNVFHKEVNLTNFCDGSEHSIMVETMPRGLFGTKEESVFKYSQIVIYDEEIRRALNFIKNVIDVIKETDDEALANFLTSETNTFLSTVFKPKETEVFKSSVVENPTMLGQVTSTWSHPDFPDDKVIYDLSFKKMLLEKFEEYKESIKSKGLPLFPKIGNVFVCGHAHIDYAWLWPVEETKRKIVRTFANAVQLAEKYDEFIYSQSSAQMYKDLKNSYPGLFEKIRNLVKQGKWEPVGGMWVESDCNVPSVESIIRQFYYGQKFFEKEFGIKSKVAWLPDVFGFSWILPQILKQSGIDYFVTTKLNWNETNDFPFDLCAWRGIDGSEVVYYSFKNYEEGYNGRISARSVINTFENFRHKDITKDILLSFGYGDGGGGPTEEMCDNYQSLNEIPGIPNVRYSRVEDYMEHLVKDFDLSKLPVWDGELYLELHRGTFTSQARTKRLHKIAETQLRNTEILNALYLENYQDEIDELWKVLLRNEFHDILPGSSIKEVYEDTERELRYIIESCEKIQQSIVEKNLLSAEGYTAFNFSSWYQSIKNNSSVKVEPLSFVHLDRLDDERMIKNEKAVNVMMEGKDYVMENDKLKVIVYANGSVNIYNKELKKWAFDKSGNLLRIYGDVPPYWENWDIDSSSKLSEWKPEVESIEILDDEASGRIKVKYKFDSTKIDQVHVLGPESDELLVETSVDWHHRRAVLKALFPTNVLSRYALYDIDGGYIQRSTTDNTSFEQARFEVLGHRWVDISQYDHGVCILNDGKYGHCVKGITIEMTLLKAGIYPDFYVDEGHHEFKYSIYLHGKQDVLDFYKRADKLNNPVKIYKGKLKEPAFNVKIEPENFKVLSVRKVDRYVYLRILECTGSLGDVSIGFLTNGLNFKKVSLVNALEDLIRDLKVVDNTVNIPAEPFKFYTVSVEL